MQCVRRRVDAECGFQASEWQFKFQFLLSGVRPKVLDAGFHPRTEQAVYVDDVLETNKYKTWLWKIAATIRRCVPVLDIMSTGTQYGVIGVTEEDVTQLCRISPREYSDVCAATSWRRLSHVDSAAIVPVIPVHHRICGDEKAEFLKHQPCLLNASRSPDLPQCASKMTEVWRKLLHMANHTKLSIRVDLTCQTVLHYLDCIEDAVRKVCRLCV